MKVTDTVKAHLNNPQRINILSTANKDGVPNVAVFGSPVLTEEHTVSLVLRDACRSYANLNENPYASCLVIIPGDKPSQTKGCRLYLKVKRIDWSRNPIYLHKRDQDGEKTWEASFDAELEKKAEARKEKDCHLVIFDIVDARPIVDVE